MTKNCFLKNSFALRMRPAIGAVMLIALTMLMRMPAHSTQTGSAVNFALQAGAYSLMDSAVETAEDLGKAGIPCKIERSVKLFKVFCGDSLSKREAAALKARLAASGYPDAFVVKRTEAAADTSKKPAVQAPTPPSAVPEPSTVRPEPVPHEEAALPPSASVPVKAPAEVSSMASETQDAAPRLQPAVAARPRQESESHGVAVQAPTGYSRKALITAVVIALVLVTIVFLCVMIILRRTGTVQAFRARRIMKRYGNIFNNVDEDSVSLRDLTEKLKGLGNYVMTEKLLDEKASGSIGPKMLRDLYDATGITEKYLEVLRTSKSWKKRAFACEKLGKIGSGKAVSLLISIVRDVNNEDEDVRAVALRSLGRIRDERAIPFLIEALGYPETWLPPRIGEILVSIGHASVEYLIQELKNFQSESRRSWAAEILGWLMAKEAVSTLIESLFDASPEVRAKTAGALGKIRDERAIVKLTELLVSEPVPFVRSRVSQALGAIGHPAVIHYLVNLLKDPEWWVRVRAVEALEQVGDKSIPSLLVSLEDEDAEVRRRSALALEKIGYVAKILSEYEEEGYKPELRKILFLVAKAGVIESLTAKLATADGGFKKAIVRLFGEAGTREASEPLVELLKETGEWTLKSRIIQSIGKIRAKNAIPLLIECMKDKEYWVRRSAVEALGVLDASDYAADVAVLLDDPSPLTRESALRALSMLKVTKHWEKIERLIYDPLPQVRKTALKAMRELGITSDRQKIMETLNEASEDVRIEAIKYCTAIMDSEALNDILRFLPYATPALRKAIVEYVSRIKPREFPQVLQLFQVDLMSKEATASLIDIAAVIGDDEAYKFVHTYTGSTDAYLREGAFRAMARFGFSRHEAIFEKALYDPSMSVRTAVLSCVDPDIGYEFLEKAKVLSKDPADDVRLALALAFGASGFLKFKPLIMSMLDDPSLKVVAGAFISLATFNDLSFLESFYRRKDIHQIREEIKHIMEDSRFSMIIESIRKIAQQAKNLEVDMLFAKSERDFAEELVRKLRESLDPVIRVKAVELLKMVAKPELFTSVLSVMKKDPCADVRLEAMGVMTSIGRENEVISALSASLADPAPAVRNRAAELLGTYKNAKALEALLLVLDTMDIEFRETVTTSLSELLSGEPEKVRDLVASVPETKTRKIGMAWLMGKSKKKGALRFLSNLLEDQDPDVKAAAIGALGKFRKKQLINSLEKFIYDPNERVRAAAVNAIAKTGGDRAFEIVHAALQDIDHFVRGRAVIGLARMDMKKTIEILKAKVAQFPEYSMYLKAVLFASGISYEERDKLDETAIGIIAELSSREDMKKMFRQASDWNKRLYALRMLSLIDPENTQEEISMALKDPAPQVREEAGRHTINLG